MSDAERVQPDAIDGITRLKNENRELAAQIGILTEAFDKYADHDARCDIVDELNNECVCGLLQAVYATHSPPAALEALRREIVEECAKVVETWDTNFQYPECMAIETQRKLATAIRALAPKAPDNA